MHDATLVNLQNLIENEITAKIGTVLPFMLIVRNTQTNTTVCKVLLGKDPENALEFTCYKNLIEHQAKSSMLGNTSPSKTGVSKFQKNVSGNKMNSVIIISSVSDDTRIGVNFLEEINQKVFDFIYKK